MYVFLYNLYVKLPIGLKITAIMMMAKINFTYLARLPSGSIVSINVTERIRIKTSLIHAVMLLMDFLLN